MNISTQHPGAHGVLRLKVKRDGERVVNAAPDIGCLHRGIENLAERRTCERFLTITDRLDYGNSMACNSAFSVEVKKRMEPDIPPRAELCRVIVQGVDRIASHLLSVGAFANQTGSDEIADCAGLSQRAPWMAALFPFFLFSLIGIPPTAGFIGKPRLFVAAVPAQSTLVSALARFMVVNSVISGCCCLNGVRHMGFGERKSTCPLACSGALAASAAATLAIRLYAQPFVNAAQVTSQVSLLLHGVMDMGAGR